MDWHFRPHPTGNDLNNPMSGEFFSDGSIPNPATALVTEALQNALDAGKDAKRGDDVPVRVRFALHRGDHAPPASAMTPLFASAMKHLKAEDSGLKDLPDFKQPGDVLVVEDFGTCGLTGDPTSDDTQEKRNNFTDFLRSDGRSRKDAGDRGSWGVGKIVFPYVSAIRGYIAYTIREEDDPKRLAMGKLILKLHHVDGQQYQPQCYFGQSWDDGACPMPIDDHAQLDQLRSVFGLTRQDEPGLSLIVPWVDPQMTFEDLREAVIHKFAYAILAGGLVVTLDDGDAPITLDRQTLTKHTRELLPKDDLPAIELAEWSFGVEEAERLTLPAPSAEGKQRWSDVPLPDDLRQTIAGKLARQERVAVRVPLQVPLSRSKETVSAHFNLYFEHHEGSTLRPDFYREQLAISAVKGFSPVSRIRALVVIDKGPLADVLRSAEPPNHTDWDSKTANFQRDYKGRTDLLTFVKKSITELINRVRAGEQEPDPTVAIDFFALPEPDHKSSPPSKKKKKQDKPGDETEKPDLDDIESKKRRVTFAKTDRGFVVRPGEPDAPRYDRLDVRMAYDVFTGSPFTQYEPADFDLTRKDRSGIDIVTNDQASYEILGPNRIRFTFTGDQYEAYVTGFDSNRDLKYINNPPKESADA